MKSFQEAIITFKVTIRKYIESCKTSNSKAFFSGLFGKACGGKTGRERAVKFLNLMDESISKGKVTNTEELIDFAIKYSDKGKKLSDSIWESIRKAAGFTHVHISYLAHLYMNDPDNEVLEHKNYEAPSFDESYDAIKVQINGIIWGGKSPLLAKYLNSTALFPATRDYGRAVLNCLSLKIPEVELKEMKAAPDEEKKSILTP